MAATYQVTFYKNDGGQASVSIEVPLDYTEFPSASELGWTRDGYSFSGWNTSDDGTGTSYSEGDSIPSANAGYWAIWIEDAPQDDVTITYNGETIAAMSDSGSQTLQTRGKFLTDDITIGYTKPGGGGGAADINLIITDASGIITDIYKPTTADIDFNYPVYSGTVPAKSMICCTCTVSPKITDAQNVTYQKLQFGSRPATPVLMLYFTDQDANVAIDI